MLHLHDCMPCVHLPSPYSPKVDWISCQLSAVTTRGTDVLSLKTTKTPLFSALQLAAKRRNSVWTPTPIKLRSRYVAILKTLSRSTIYFLVATTFEHFHTSWNEITGSNVKLRFVSDKQSDMYLIPWTRSRIFSINGRELHYKSQNLRGILALICTLQWLQPWAPLLFDRCHADFYALIAGQLHPRHYSIQHVVLVSVWQFKEILKKRCENVIIQRAVVTTGWLKSLCVPDDYNTESYK